MNYFTKQTVLDILSTLGISVIPFFLFYFFMNVQANFSLILGIFFSLIILSYRNNLIRFLIVVVISLLVSNIAFALFHYFFIAPQASMVEPDYSIFFYFINTFLIIKGSVTGIIFIKIYYFLVGNRVSSILNKIILVSLFFLTSVLSFSIISTNIKNENEGMKKIELAKRIAVSISKNELTQFNNKELIDLGIISNIYKNKEDTIFTEYGSNFRIQKLDQEVSLVFEEFPSKEPCYYFYNNNNLSSYGFKITKIDDIVKQNSDMYSDGTDSFTKKVCYSGKDKVTIEFIGSIEDITAFAKWFELPQNH